MEYPGFGVRFPQDTLFENTPLAQHIDPSSIMSCTKSEQDMPTPQIKSEAKDGVANQACVYVCETPFVDSSLQDNVGREKYSNLESIVSNQLK